MFTEIFHKLTGSPKEDLSLHPFTPYPPASDRAAWQALPDSLKEALVKNGRAFLNYEYPVLRATDYMDFCRTGNRQRYQERLFNRRIALNHLILAECVEYEGRFLDDILNGIFVICEEAAWQLPAHNSYIRDTPQLLLPDVNRPVVD
ncbi:MAG: heparinase, partial [Lachnospiraceae bacterium]|nr:heparinase [Lachnospiraceae bacterium]